MPSLSNMVRIRTKYLFYLKILGYFRTAEMVKVGAPLSLIGALVSMAMIHVTGGFSWTFDVFNTCPDYLDASAPCKQAAAVNFNLTAT